MTTASIFISSVQKELAEERRAVKAFVEGDPLLRRYFTAFLFEDLAAADRRADDVYLDAVDRCAVYVGVFGNEYGFEDAGGQAPTEREFDRATRRGKPRLIFVRGADDRARHPKMAALVRKAGAQLIRRRFDSPQELTTALYASLVEYLERTGRLRTKPFDAAACPDAGLADLSSEKLGLFLSRAQSQRGYPLGPGTPMATALAHLNLLDGGQPTHAAVLLFGVQPQRFLLTSEVKCMHFHGTEVRKPIPSYQIYRGTVFELVDQAVDFVMSKINRAVGTRALGTQAPVEYELPREAVAEAVVNAVAHRDYASNASVQVMLFADRLDVWNPGELPPSLTLDELRRPHASIPRNPLIAEPLFLARYAEKAGSGILDMIARCRESGLPAPEFRQSGGQFIQTLGRPRPRVAPEVAVTEGAGPESRPESRSESRPEWWRARPEWRSEWGVDSVHDRLLAALQAGPRRRSELASALGHSTVSGALRRALHDLREVGLVVYTIPEKPGSRLQRYRFVRPGGEDEP
jgi:predicted HTH transcriptional regulator